MYLQDIAGTLFFTGLFALASSAAEPDVVVTGKSVPSLAGFDRAMIALIQETGVPGGTLAVAKDGRMLYHRGFGYADRDKREPVESTSLFRIASISKPITAVAVLQLVEKK
jgi:N-acyl-D-amino-acid deacylase